MRYLVSGWAGEVPIARAPDETVVGRDENEEVAVALARIFAEAHAHHVQYPAMVCTVRDLLRPEGEQIIFATGRGYAYWGMLREIYPHSKGGA